MPPRKKAKDSGADFYRMVFEESRDSILVLELSDSGAPRILDANPAALALHGFTHAALVGKPVGVLGASVSPGRFRNSAGTGAFEVKHPLPGGGKLVTEVTARNIKSGGRYYGILIERDVTWRRKLEEESRLVSSRLMQEREAEKKKLAAGIHDSLGAMQVGLSSELLLLEDFVRRGDNSKALAGIARARKILKSSASGLKKACVESWPPSLAVSGLAAALSELVSAFSARSGIKVEEELSFPEDGGVSESPSAIVIFRLAQEALSNAERHSGAKNLRFFAGLEDKWLALEVSDDGCGFRTAPSAVNKACLGLKIMEDAAGTAGGQIMIYSSPGKGTRIKASLPLEQA